MAGIAPQACCAEHLFGSPVKKAESQSFKEENRLLSGAGSTLGIRDAQTVPTLSRTAHESVSNAREKTDFGVMPRDHITQAGLVDQSRKVNTYRTRGNILEDVRLNTVNDTSKHIIPRHTLSGRFAFEFLTTLLERWNATSWRHGDCLDTAARKPPLLSLF